MMIFQYGKNDFISKTCEFIDKSEPFILIIEGWRAKIVKKTLPFYMKYLLSYIKKDIIDKIKIIFYFAPLAFFTVGLWVILNHAVFVGKEFDINYEEKEGKIFIFFKVK